jgi:dissimilatory sulfite reductase related protein
MAPMVRSICQDTGIRLREIYTLFPQGPARGACKIAGLPKPDGCV